MCPLQEVEDILLEIRTGVDLRLIEKRNRAVRLDFPGDLLRHPCILAAVADEDQPLARPFRPLRHPAYCTNGLVRSNEGVVRNPGGE
jgi:hypothetical protein